MFLNIPCVSVVKTCFIQYPVQWEHNWTSEILYIENNIRKKVVRFKGVCRKHNIVMETHT